MFVCAVFSLGLFAFSRLKVDLMPDISFPVVVVVTAYPGVSPEEIENFVTKPIEEGLSTVKGLKSIRSQSKESVSMVIVEFEWGQDMDDASFEVREKLDPVLEDLPDDVHRPFLVKADASSMMPTAVISFDGPQGMLKLRRYADDILKRELEKIDGVAGVTVTGGLERNIQVEINVEKLKQYNIPISQVEMALKAENFNIPGGNMTEGRSEYRVRSMGEFTSPEQIENIAVGMTGIPSASASAAESAGLAAIAHIAPKPILLKDIAVVKDSYKEIRAFSRLNGKDSITLLVTKESVANTVEVSDRVQKAMKELQGKLPAGSNLTLVLDGADFIRKSISNIKEHAMIGGILAVCVVFFFLVSGYSTLVTALSIPFSFVATFVLMYFNNLTLNIITMGGLTLAIGRFVDDSIVVLENTYRHIEEGKSPREAAVSGANEVMVAIMAAMAAGISVFLPLLFVGGLVSEIFAPMTWTVVFALLSSLVVSITFAPMVASRVLRRPSEGGSRFFIAWAKRVDSIADIYKPMVQWTLRHRPLMMFIAVIVMVATVFVTRMVGLEFSPKMDRGEIMLEIKTPVGSSLQVLDEKSRRLENIFKQVPEKKLYMGRGGETGGAGSIMMMRQGSGINAGTVSLMLVDKADRKRSTEEVKNELRDEIKSIPGLKFKFTEMFGSMSEAPIVVTIMGDELEELSRLGTEVSEKMKKVPGVVDVDLNWEAGSPEYRLVIDREKAGRLGLTAGQIGASVRTLVSGTDVTKYREKGKEYDITVRAREADRDWMDSLNSIYITTPVGVKVPLTEVARIEIAKGPSEISRNERWRSIKIMADKTGRPLGDIIKDVTVLLKDTRFPEGYVWEFGGEEEDRRETFGGIFLAMVMSIVLMYIILASQFESLSQPFIVMLSIPLELIGVSSALLLAGLNFDLMSMLGILTVTGIVVGVSILMITFINQLRERGMERDEAIVKGAGLRLRPILMTSLSAAFGMLPMALGFGEGAEMWRPLAIAVIGGLVSSLFLTLLLVPPAYAALDDLIARLPRRRGRKENA